MPGALLRGTNGGGQQGSVIMSATRKLISAELCRLYGYSYTDWRTIYNTHHDHSLTPPSQKRTHVCAYCLSSHTSNSCPSCGAPNEHSEIKGTS